jgi:iron(III) transport system permease protein
MQPAAAGWSFSNYTSLAGSHSFLRLVLQSVGVSAGSATVATLFGTLLAVLVIKTSVPLRFSLALAAVTPIILPGFITAISYIFLFGRNGLITYKLFGISWDVYSWKSVCILQTIDQTTTAFLMVAAALLTVGNKLEESARTLGAGEWRILWTITLGLAQPMIVASFLLNFMRAMGDFGTPLIVGGPFDTLASASYSQLIGRYDLSMAATYNVVLLLISMAVYFYYIQRGKRYTGNEQSWRDGTTGRLHLEGWPIWLAWCIGLLFVLLIGVLVIAVFFAAFTRHMGYDYRFTLDYFHNIWERGLGSTLNTFVFAMVVGICASFGGQIFAYLIQRVKVPGSRVLDMLATLPFALPGTFIGVGYAIAFNTPPLLLTGTWVIVAMNLIIRKLPLGLRTGAALLNSMDSSLDEASALLGSSRLQTFFRITLPNLRPAMVACGLYAFVTTIQALGSIIFIITPGTKLLSVDVFEAVVRGDLGVAAAYSMLMLIMGAMGGAALLILTARQRKPFFTALGKKG